MAHGGDPAPNFSWSWAISLDPRALRHEPWALSHEPWSSNHNSRLIEESFGFKMSPFLHFFVSSFLRIFIYPFLLQRFKASKFPSFQVSRIPRFQDFKISNFQNFQSFELPNVPKRQRFKITNPQEYKLQISKKQKSRNTQCPNKSLLAFSHFQTDIRKTPQVLTNHCQYVSQNEDLGNVARRICAIPVRIFSISSNYLLKFFFVYASLIWGGGETCQQFLLLS